MKQRTLMFFMALMFLAVSISLVSAEIGFDNPNVPKIAPVSTTSSGNGSGINQSYADANYWRTNAANDGRTNTIANWRMGMASFFLNESTGVGLQGIFWQNTTNSLTHQIYSSLGNLNIGSPRTINFLTPTVDLTINKSDVWIRGNVTAPNLCYANGSNCQASGGGGSSNTTGSNLYFNFTDQNNSGTAETNLYKFSIGAGTLNNTNDTATIDISGDYIGSTSSKRFQFYINNNNTIDSGAVGLATGGSWGMIIQVTRTGSNTAEIASRLQTTTATTFNYDKHIDMSGVDFTSAINTNVTGTASGVGAASNDISARWIEVRLNGGVAGTGGGGGAAAFSSYANIAFLNQTNSYNFNMTQNFNNGTIANISVDIIPKAGGGAISFFKPARLVTGNGSIVYNNTGNVYLYPLGSGSAVSLHALGTIDLIAPTMTVGNGITGQTFECDADNCIFNGNTNNIGNGIGSNNFYSNNFMGSGHYFDFTPNTYLLFDAGSWIQGFANFTNVANFVQGLETTQIIATPTVTTYTMIASGGLGTSPVDAGSFGTDLSGVINVTSDTDAGSHFDQPFMEITYQTPCVTTSFLQLTCANYAACASDAGYNSKGKVQVEGNDTGFELVSPPIGGFQGSVNNNYMWYYQVTCY